MARRIRLCRYETTGVSHIDQADGYDLRVEADMAEEMENEVFIWERQRVDAITGLPVDVFCAVASTVDMEELPRNEPSLELPHNFFRLAFADLRLGVINNDDENPQEPDEKIPSAETAWEIIHREVCHLTEIIPDLDRMQSGEVFWCGPVPEESSSSSASSQSSSSQSSQSSRSSSPSSEGP